MRGQAVRIAILDALPTRSLHTMTTIHRLYPPTEEAFPVRGLYLQHRLHEKGIPGQPFVYTNFITSLDGRIAVANAAGTGTRVPPDVTNEHDWRLYQELAGQADLLVTSGRFFRQAAAGEAQDHLPVGREPSFADILEWRTAQGLDRQPDIAILSGSLDIPASALESYRDRRIIILTGDAAPPERRQRLAARGVEILTGGTAGQVDGRKMIDALGARGYRSIYSVAGPGVCHTLVAAGVLDRLYLTITHQLLSGEHYDTLISGNLLSPVRGLRLVSLYHDAGAPPGAGQWFCVFEPAGRDPE